MTQIVHDTIGWVHVLASVLSMIFGAIVILSPKGTKSHKRSGYIFVVCMVGVLVTAMLIYRLFGTIGPFHFIAIIGFIYLAIGIIPALLRTKNWLRLHINFMYWSVVGLYAAFAAEIGVRLPDAPFWWAVAIAVAFITTLGAIYYGKYKESWRGILERSS